MKHIENTSLYIISESEIKFKSHNGRRARSVCPVCKYNREHPEDPSVAWDLSSGVGYCHHCKMRFKIDNNPESFGNGREIKQSNVIDDSRRTDVQRSKDYRTHLLPLDNNAIQYLENRGISAETAIEAGVCSRQVWRGTSWFPYVAFPFFDENKIVNVQYKAADLDHKSFFMETGGTLIPWNIRCIDEDKGWEPLYITEGMIDALALIQCGCSYVVSVPNGAECRMECFNKYRERIYRKFAYIVFAGDTDEQGLKLRDRVCEYFSEKDVVCVKWKSGGHVAKDADELLMTGGAAAVTDALRYAELNGGEYLSVSGAGDSGLERLFETGMPTGKGIDLRGFDDIVHFEEGNLLLVTGYPGSGKSTLVNYIVMRLMVMYKWKTLFFSPEKMPQKYHEAELVSLLCGKEFQKGMTKEEFCNARDRLSGNVVFIDEAVSTVEDIVRLARRSVRVYGIKVLVIDPFVYLSIPAIPGASETQKIAEMLKKLMLATREMHIVTILVAHPRKPSIDGPMEPSLYEVAGSANFYNFCDAGIIMERVKSGDNLVKITCGKARREFNGCLGECQLAYDSTCGRYSPCIKDHGVYTTEYAAFDRNPWFDMPDRVPGNLFGESEISSGIYTDPGEQ